MRSPPAVLLVLLSLLLAPLAIAAEGDDKGDEPDGELARTPVRTPWSDPKPDSGGGAVELVSSAAWYVVWAALACVAGVVVVSSMTKSRPVPGDPLVTAPGAAFAPRVSALTVAVPVPERAAFESGRDLAYRASPATAEHALRLMHALGLGEAALVSERLGERVVGVRGCSTCRGREGRRTRWGRRQATEGECAFERGFLAGAFETVLGCDVRVQERRCAGRADKACEFVVLG